MNERSDPTDQAARDRIRTDLKTNLLVEAGAGSGKTTELVGRMLALVRSGVSLSQITAVTFTRKAAGELSQKFREELEQARREAASSGDRAASLLERALQEIEHCFIGTIHAFCARLLRERPFAAGVDPDFAEVTTVEEEQLGREFWAGYLDDLQVRSDPIVARLHEAGIELHDLVPFSTLRGRRRGAGAQRGWGEAFREMISSPDVVFPFEETPVPEFSAVRRELEGLLERARELLPPRPLGSRGADELQAAMRRLLRPRRTSNWDHPADFFADLQTLYAPHKVVQNRWAADADGKRRVKSLGEDVERFVKGPAERALDAWYVHRYGLVLGFLSPLVEAFAEHRRSNGQLTFQDLLAVTAGFLRRDPEARAELGERYRYLLVDEFQDTDPLQAEVCLLLTSPPEEGAEWLQVRPRAGALFVVGDPKQSIYRFRRADIEVYNLVRDLFARFGDVIELTENFRSRPAIGTFVDAVFGRLFPPAATPEQAGFAPLNTQQGDEPGRVGCYQLCPGGKSKDLVRAADSRAVASWIAQRIGCGERSAGDFLVLPYPKAALAFYTRELEKRDIPVTTTGAGMIVDRELEELLVLLEALADPGDAVWTVAALQGLFFGLDPQRLLAYRLQSGSPTIERPVRDPESAVGMALSTLRRWSQLFRRVPLDAAMEQVVHEIGLLPLAAAGEMAESRAGSLAHALEVAASVAIRGGGNLRSAIKAIESTIESADVEAPLRPGRTDAVRVMNLHKAKGLEAPVVILPYPMGFYVHEQTRHVRRVGGTAEGWLNFTKPWGRASLTIARAPRWNEHEARELSFLQAEHARLLYVAATRAREELVVAECAETLKDSPWRELHDELERLATPLELVASDPFPRRRATVTIAEIAVHDARVEAARKRAAEPAYVLATVTAVAEEEFAFQGAEGRGREWGTIVHGAIAAMGRGRSGEELRGYCHALLVSNERPLDSRGVPAELEELMGLLERVRASQAWADLTASGMSRWELAVARLEGSEGEPPRLLTGAIDALQIGPAGTPWRILDWKTDSVEGEEWNARERLYRRQVEEYGGILTGLMGVAAEGAIERVTGGDHLDRSVASATAGPGLGPAHQTKSADLSARRL